MPGLRPFLASALLVSSFAACDGDVLVGEFEVEAATNGGASGAGGTTASVSTATSGGSAGAPGCEQRRCQSGATYACGNCDDDDKDGAVDAEDPDCLSPCQDDEASYHPNIQGQDGGSKCERDCYFDRGVGAGNDGCQWDHHCDELGPNPECAYDPETSVGSAGLSCEEAASSATEDCQDTCLPLVPNGCDCFGCCQIEGAPNAVWIGSELDGQGSCSHLTLADPEKCRPCTPVTTCFNLCDPCEVCVGRSEPPATCGDGGETPQTCHETTEACGLAGQSDCSVDEYCITGCCIITIK